MSSPGPGRDGAPPPRRPRHLLDPADLRADHVRHAGTSQALTSVQRWVMSILAATTILHLAAGLAIAAVFVEPKRPVSEIGLNVLAAAFGVVAVAVALLIHGRRPLSPWLLLGVMPGLVGAWFTFR